MKEFENYKKYKWFYTLSGKLVVGGKNSTQNDSLLKEIKSIRKEFIIMHTADPGSPFSVIVSDVKKVSRKDIEEAAIFTACFSQAWKSGKNKTLVHLFNSSQIYKSDEMKSGTWGVMGNVEKLLVNLSLVLTKQESVLRAVPEKSVKNNKDILARIYPGRIPKEDIFPKLAIEIGDKFSQSEILSALPAGGLRFLANKTK